MSSLSTVLLLAPLAGLAFALAFVGFEYFNGGVQTHHFLARADLPGFSNWLSLFVLPMLGVALAVRVKSERAGKASGNMPQPIAAGALGSLGYGAALAASFHIGLEQVSFFLFVGLFLCSVVFPVYRAEYIVGFVVGMTIAFGSVIPLVFALFFAAISFAARRVAAYILSTVRKPRR